MTKFYNQQNQYLFDTTGYQVDLDAVFFWNSFGNTTYNLVKIIVIHTRIDYDDRWIILRKYQHQDTISTTYTHRSRMADEYSSIIADLTSQGFQQVYPDEDTTGSTSFDRWGWINPFLEREVKEKEKEKEQTRLDYILENE